jgi:hypothetical protein
MTAGGVSGGGKGGGTLAGGGFEGYVGAPRSTPCRELITLDT